MKFAVIVFPGSNCDHDAHYTAEHVLGQDAEFVWHKETSLKGADVVILPGGFSHGDYLRTGAIARFSPIMATVADFARKRRAGPRDLQRLPGAARGRAAAGRDAAQSRSEVSLRARLGAHRADRHALHDARIARPGAEAADRARRRQLLRRSRRDPACSNRADESSSATATPSGQVTDAANPNGSLNNIAGICNEARNVVGLMPHPERACEAALGSEDGRVIFESVIGALTGQSVLRSA